MYRLDGYNFERVLARVAPGTTAFHKREEEGEGAGDGMEARERERVTGRVRIFREVIESISTTAVE